MRTVNLSVNEIDQQITLSLRDLREITDLLFRKTDQLKGECIKSRNLIELVEDATEGDSYKLDKGTLEIAKSLYSEELKELEYFHELFERFKKFY